MHESILHSDFFILHFLGSFPLCYNADCLCVTCCTVRKWWNWQTHHLEGVAPKGVGVQVPPSAPFQRP